MHICAAYKLITCKEDKTELSWKNERHQDFKARIGANKFPVMDFKNNP